MLFIFLSKQAHNSEFPIFELMRLEDFLAGLSSKQ